MEAMALQAEVREGRGKGPARQLRMKGLIPAVFYGPGKETEAISVDPKLLTRILRDSPYRRNQVVELDIGGRRELTLVKDLGVHPLTRDILHADFYSVAEGRLVETFVPFDTEGRAVGVIRGGELHRPYRELRVRAAPLNVPAKILVDVTPLDINKGITVAELKLDEGVEVVLPPNRQVVFVDAKKERAAKPGDEKPAK